MNLSKQRIEALLKDKVDGIKLSIYMPTHPKSNSQSITQDTIRFKNALQNVKHHPSYDEAVLGTTYAALLKLLDDTEFWKYQDVGLAIFAHKEGYEVFHLPYEITEALYIDNEFIISPLSIMESIHNGFYLLDVNLNKPRMFYGSNNEMREVNAEHMPGSFQDVAAREEYKAELQHQTTRMNNSAGFHGHNPEEDVDEDIQRYLRMIADAANKYLGRGEGLPLLLAGTENRIGNIRQHIHYNRVVSDGLTGNHENMTAQNLFDASKTIMNDYFDSMLNQSKEKLASSKPELVVNGKDAIEHAIGLGRIERLFVPALRKTQDGLQSDSHESIVLQLPEEISESEKLIRGVLAQAGTIQAAEINHGNTGSKLQALCRF